jgi:DEAD/DEAH box helicase domain-containing protein
LMTYLAAPDPERWAGLAFVRCLGWFDQGTMRSDELRERFETQCSSMGSEGYRQIIEDLPEERAYGGLGWDHGEDPLSVPCALPLEGIQALTPGLLAIGVVMDDMHGFEANVYKGAWLGFLRLYNLVQFLPLSGYFTRAGAAKGVYEAIPWRYAKAVLVPEGEPETEGGAPETGEVIAEAVAEVQDGLRQVMAKGCPPPEVAYELQDENGAISAEAELAWPERRVAGLLPEQHAFAAVFAASGWVTITLDPDGQWVGRADALLMGDRHD